MRKRFWKGLRAIELGVVFTAIIAIFAVVALRYPRFKCRAMQSEAKYSLAEIYKAQQRFHTEYDSYASLERLLIKDGRVSISAKYFTFSDVLVPGRDSFSIKAEGQSGTLVEGEIWTVNHFNDIKMVKSVCENH